MEGSAGKVDYLPVCLSVQWFVWQMLMYWWILHSNLESNYLKDKESRRMGRVNESSVLKSHQIILNIVTKWFLSESLILLLSNLSAFHSLTVFVNYHEKVFNITMDIHIIIHHTLFYLILSCLPITWFILFFHNLSYYFFDPSWLGEERTFLDFMGLPLLSHGALET